MKNYIALALALLAFKFGFSQTTPATGTVVGENNAPLHYAFIQDKELNNATYTDSLGHFTLTVGPSSHLLISCNGYSRQTIDVSGKQTFNITLQKDPNAASGGNADDNIKIVEDAFKTSTVTQTGASVGFMGAATFMYAKETHGSRFMFDKWVHGYLVKVNGEIVQTPGLLLNYDKQDGDLYMTADRASVMTGDKRSLKSFTLIGPDDKAYNFEMMTGISTDHYSQVLVNGSKYKIYKLTITKFIPSNYKTDGVMSTGNQYDEYADEYSYYLVDVATTAFQPLVLKKKALKQIFASQGGKIDGFLSSHSGKMDDDWIITLGETMNQ